MEILRKFFFSLPKKHLLLVVFWIVAIGVLLAIYFGTNRNATKALLEETSKRQLIVTEAAASSIQEFILLAGRSQVLLAENYQNLFNPDEQLAFLDRYVENRKNTPIVGVAVTDKNGLVIQNSTANGSREMVGVNLSDREYFKWSMQAKTGEYFVSKPIILRQGMSKGKGVIAIATPIIRGEAHQGVVVSAIELDKFNETYLKVFVQEDTQVYLLDSSGEILIGKNEQDIGKSVYSAIDQFPIPGSESLKKYIAQQLASPQPKSLDLFLPINGKLSRTIVTHAPIGINFQSWVLVVVSPADSLLTYFAPIYIQQLTIIISIFFFILFMILIMMRSLKVKK